MGTGIDIPGNLHGLFVNSPHIYLISSFWHCQAMCERELLKACVNSLNHWRCLKCYPNNILRTMRERSLETHVCP